MRRYNLTDLQEIQHVIEDHSQYPIRQERALVDDPSPSATLKEIIYRAQDSNPRQAMFPDQNHQKLSMCLREEANVTGPKRKVPRFLEGNKAIEEYSVQIVMHS